MKRSRKQFEAELLERLRDLFLEQHKRSPISQEEFLDFAAKHGDDVVARLKLEDEFRDAGVNPNVKH
jgi:uncharacterized protein with von Willebrand factor type A (vWA) domain